MKMLIAVTATIAIVCVQPALSVAGDMPADTSAKPTSFVPHAHSNHHVYGSPIQPAIIGHARTSHRKHVPNK